MTKINIQNCWIYLHTWRRRFLIKITVSLRYKWKRCKFYWIYTEVAKNIELRLLNNNYCWRSARYLHTKLLNIHSIIVNVRFKLSDIDIRSMVEMKMNFLCAYFNAGRFDKNLPTLCWLLWNFSVNVSLVREGKISLSILFHIFLSFFHSIHFSNQKEAKRHN